METLGKFNMQIRVAIILNSIFGQYIQQSAR